MPNGKRRRRRLGLGRRAALLPQARKRLDFDGALHGKDGPVPIRRTKAADWAPLAKAVHAFAEERQIPFVADMNADFRDGYGGVPMSNWPRKRASAADLLPHGRCAPPQNLTRH